MEHLISVICLIVLKLTFVNTLHNDIDSDATGAVKPGLQLALVHVLYRHGDRNPVQPYPSDPYRDEENWPEGFGQLTKIGKMQQFKLGQYLRGRYSNFLSQSYSPYEILVQSSNVDRAVTSALSNLAGLYPPNSERSLWNKDLEWQPIPVHTQPEIIDNKLNMKAPCPRYNEIEKEFFKNSEELQQLNEDNKVLYEILTKYTGETILSPKDVDFVNDVLYIEQLYNMTLPSWTQEVLKYQANLTYLSAFSFKMVSYTPEMQKLKGGPLLKEIIQNIKNKTSSVGDTRRKIFMYSAHDTTVATLLNTLDIFDVHSPPYVAMVMVDLYSNITTNEYFVEISYRNETESPPFIMHVPGCASTLCPLGQFIEATKSKIPNNWDEECKVTTHFFDVIGMIVAGLVSLLTLGLFISLGMLIMSYMRNKKRGGPKPPVYPYLHLQMDEGDEYG